MSVSIALATFNGERHLRDQLDSFSSQTRWPDELVVCDDASSDQTWTILQTFAKTSPFSVRLHRNEENIGFGRNFARAISLSAGDIIFLSDQDDVWFPQKLERMIAAFADPDTMAVTCDQEIADECLRPTGQTTFGMNRSTKSEHVFATGCCTAIRSSLRELLLPLPLEIDSHDTWLTILARSTRAHVSLPEVLQYHRRHGNNITANHLLPLSKESRIASLRRRFSISPDQLEFLYPYYAAAAGRLQSSPAEAWPPPTIRLCAINQLGSRIGTMRSRHTLALLPRWRRIRIVVSLARSGAYTEFSGHRSMLKDLLARRITADAPRG